MRLAIALWVSVLGTLAVATVTAFDVARSGDDEAFRRAGAHRLFWIVSPPAAAIVFFPLGLAASAAWYRVWRPRVHSVRSPE